MVLWVLRVLLTLLGVVSERYFASNLLSHLLAVRFEKSLMLDDGMLRFNQLCKHGRACALDHGRLTVVDARLNQPN
jgi:hypothetical protein